MTTETYSLSVLRRLEAESIHILREVAAEFERPVLMYSVGKDSSVLLRLAQKAFHPGRIPFPLLHVDTAYKFPEMYAFRDRVCAELGVELRVLRNEAALAADANPWDLGTVQVLRLPQDAGPARRAEGGQLRRGDRRRTPRGGALARQGAHLFVPRPPRPVGSRNASARSCGTCTTGASTRARASACSRCRTGPSSTSGATSGTRTIPVVPLYFAAEREVVRRGGQLIPVGEKTRLLPGERAGAHAWSATDRSAAIRAPAPSRRARARSPTSSRSSRATRYSERVTRVIDHDQDGSMEQKKREGYF